MSLYRSYMLALPIAMVAQCAQAADFTPPSSAAEAFERYTRERIIQFDNAGRPYGVERYLPGQRVIWSFLDGQCISGSWFAEADQICFDYEDAPSTLCWDFEITPDGLTVSTSGGDAQTPLILTESIEQPEEMLCYGPEVGV